MATVSGRARTVRQPRGGYIKPSMFEIVHRDDGIELSQESIGASNVGSVVDYLTRFMMGATVEEAFDTSIKGAFNVRKLSECYSYLDTVKGLDDVSISAACRLTGYDTAYRAGPSKFEPVEQINADDATISNIRTMVNRSLSLWEEYGPVTKSGFTLEGGYTKIITQGDGDFLTADTVWEFKVLSDKPTNKHTLQLLIYYLMGMKSEQPEFKEIKRLGIFNPRMNDVYLLDVERIPKEIIEEVSSVVIGY